MAKIINCKTCNAEIASTAKFCPKCGAKNKKPVYLRWWFWVFAIFVLILIIALSGGNGENSEQTSNSEQGVEQNSENSSKQWVELIQFKGKGDKKSEVFTYNGGKARLRYEFNSSDFGVFAAYVVKEGVDIMTEGGLPEVMLDGSESGESNLSHLRKGNYYLNISSANGSWTVIVEELK